MRLAAVFILLVLALRTQGQVPHPISNNRPAVQNRQLAATMLADEKTVEQDLAVTEKKLAAIPAQKGRYYVDFFALAVGEDAKGVAVYDFGTLPGVP